MAQTNDLILSTKNLSLETAQLDSPDDTAAEFDNRNFPTPVDAGPSATPLPKLSKWKHALEEAQFIAGGLVSRPSESTKHFSILRHSHGLVFYHGLSTSVAVTIFADHPLPPDRTLWLQKKGWTGNTGMKAKTLAGLHNTWIDVTPAEVVQASQLPVSDERAWQRDINRFLDKAPKALRHHKVRETDVIRIPFVADDGYFRIVLCAGNDSKDRKVLCPSPVFRVASVSTASSSIKGASLTTLPVEIGVKLASRAAMTAAGTAVAPVASAVQSRVGQYMPNPLIKEAGTALCDKSALPSKLGAANEHFDEAMRTSYDLWKTDHDDLARANVVGNLAGPEPPYPMRLKGRIVRGMGRGEEDTGMPTANVNGVPEDLKARLLGVYFGWASITSRSSKEKADLSEGYKESIISVSPDAPSVRTAAPAKRSVKAYLIHDYHGAQFFDAKISLIVMGFLRPTIPSNTEAFAFETYKDITVAQLSLNRPAWSAEAAKETLKPGSVTERYVVARLEGQRQLDKVPLDRMGIRMSSAAMRDRLAGKGGLRVPR
ncbi:hypothetical protein MMC13_003283 [Lambiella insularis]|nr:hypothetical protein [Lambiella insularis]